MIRLFVGWDEREAIGSHVFLSSVLRRTSVPVQITHLCQRTITGILPKRWHGSNAFTFSRYLIPLLCDWSGTAIFMDGADMLMRADLWELESLREHNYAVQYVHHDYKTRNPRKYIGTPMESVNTDYYGKNWSSVMLINCAHFAWRNINPKQLDQMTPEAIHSFSWIKSIHQGNLSHEWNCLVDEGYDDAGAKVLHWTAGIPAFEHYTNAPCHEEWYAELDALVAAQGSLTRTPSEKDPELARRAELYMARPDCEITYPAPDVSSRV